jgi:hypothetical protein
MTQNVVIGDGTHANAGFSAGVSGAFTFVPTFMDSQGVMTWYTMDSGEVLDARERLSLSVRLPSKGSQVARVTAKVVVPLMDDDDSTLKIGEGIATCEFVLPKRMTDVQRGSLVALMANFLRGSGFASDDSLLQGDTNAYAALAVTNLQSPNV